MAGCSSDCAPPLMRSRLEFTAIVPNRTISEEGREAKAATWRSPSRTTPTPILEGEYRNISLKRLLFSILVSILLAFI